MPGVDSFQASTRTPQRAPRAGNSVPASLPNSLGPPTSAALQNPEAMDSSLPDRHQHGRTLPGLAPASICAGGGRAGPVQARGRTSKHVAHQHSQCLRDQRWIPPTGSELGGGRPILYVQWSRGEDGVHSGEGLPAPTQPITSSTTGVVIANMGNNLATK